MAAKQTSFDVGADGHVYIRNLVKDLPLSKITQAGGTATATIEAHGLTGASNVINISGADQDGYKGDFTATSATADTLAFAVASGTTSPATGDEIICGVYLNDATITGAMYDSTGTAVTGVGTITFDYKTGSNGMYVGNLPAAADLTDGDTYTLVATVTAATGEVLPLKLKGPATSAGA